MNCIVEVLDAEAIIEEANPEVRFATYSDRPLKAIKSRRLRVMNDPAMSRMSAQVATSSAEVRARLKGATIKAIGKKCAHT